MGDCTERKSAVTSQIPKSMHCSCDANFELIIIKHAEETNNCVMELNVPLLGMTFHQNPLSGGLKSAECQAI
jgi:hypothetical protein